MKEADILSIVQSELEQSLSFSPNSPFGQSSPSIEEPLKYYLGLPNGTETEGKSQVMSTDVADAIEWILPQIMRAFTQHNDVVSIDPINEGDEDQAQLETQYIYDIIMKRNPGFIILHTAVKDALLQRNGIIKTYYEQTQTQASHELTNLTPEQATYVLSQPNIQPTQHSQNEDGSINLSFVQTEEQAKITIEAVPLENFYVNSDHNSIDLTNARFTAHSIVKTISDCRKDGVDEKLIKQISPTLSNASAYRFELQGESSLNTRLNPDESMTEVTIYECYLHIDTNGDGIAEYNKVTVAGEGNPNVVLSIEPLEYSPWVATTAILMSHKFQGLSIYDRLKQIQDQKTALIRNILDNMYLINNQQKKVIENMVNMDDVLTSRVGGNIRVKRMDAIEPIVTQPLDPMSVEMLKYLDEIKAGRVGVSADGPSAPQNIGDRVGSQGVQQLMSAKEELVGLIIRLMAETLLKPLCLKIRTLAHSYQNTIEDYKFKGKWIQVNPQVWPLRSNAMCTINVGTGSSDKTQKAAAMQAVQQMQEKLAQSPAAYLIDDTHVYRVVDDYLKTFGIPGAARYMFDPASPEAQERKQQAMQSQQENAQKAEQAALAQTQLEQAIAQAELQKAQAQQDNVQLKAQIEQLKSQLATQKQISDTQIAGIQLQLQEKAEELKHFKSEGELAFKYDELEAKMALEHEKLNKQSKIFTSGEAAS